MHASDKAEMHLLMQNYVYHEQKKILQLLQEQLNDININNPNWSIDLK